MSGRVYQRKFDWDEARRLRKTGMTYEDVADILGISPMAVYFACNPRSRAQNQMAHAAYQQSGTCEDCGGPCSYNPTRMIKRCRECATAARVTTVRDGELKCSRCQTWLPDRDFHADRSARTEHRRFRNKVCRACATEEKREWRRRHALVCVDCGGPVNPDNRNRETPRCRQCWRESQRVARRMAVA